MIVKNENHKYDIASVGIVPMVLLTFGIMTFVIGVILALRQDDIKKVFTYCSISQTGFLVMGISTFLSSGISGALLVVVYTSICCCGLLLVTGMVEKTSGTSSLSKLGSLIEFMPITFISYCILSLALIGFPVLSCYFSNRLIFNSLFRTSPVIISCALIGWFLTILLLIKNGYIIFLRKRESKWLNIKENNWLLITPIAALALISTFAGLFNTWIYERFIQPLLVSDFIVPNNLDFTYNILMAATVAISIITSIYIYIQRIGTLIQNG
jgi:formate hydrogenlyase subunit 3/multisubunit Na+/H+ antiporter MnhD subunit